MSIPLLIAGLFLPFYVGYLRGAIVVDTVLERIRGWVYFTAGTTFYAASLAAVLLREWADISLLSYLALYAVGFVLSRGWIRSIVRSTGNPLSNKDVAVVGATVGGTAALMFNLWSVEETVRVRIMIAKSFGEQILMLFLGIAGFMFLVFLIIERVSRQLVASEQEIERRYDVNSLRGAVGQVWESSWACLLKGAESDRKALVSAVLSFLAWFLFLSVSAMRREVDMSVATAIGLIWLSLYVFALYRYAKVRMNAPTTKDIFYLTRTPCSSIRQM